VAFLLEHGWSVLVGVGLAAITLFVQVRASRAVATQTTLPRTARITVVWSALSFALGMLFTPIDVVVVLTTFFVVTTLIGIPLAWVNSRRLTSLTEDERESMLEQLRMQSEQHTERLLRWHAVPLLYGAIVLALFLGAIVSVALTR
jgi:hypothetical protein